MHSQRQLASCWSDAKPASADAADASAQQTSRSPLFGQHQDRPILPPDVLSWTGFEKPHQVPDQLSQHTLASVHICMPDQGKASLKAATIPYSLTSLLLV